MTTTVPTMEAGVSALRRQLSMYIEQVRAGSELIVTRRGRPVARIVALNDGSALHRGIDGGWIRPAVRQGPIGGAVRHRSERRSCDVLDDDR
jgi:prevent-host-death family protein